MGRYDALTQLEEPKDKNTRPGATPPPASKKQAITPPQPEEDITTILLANQQTSKEVNQKSSKLANQQDSKPVSQQTSKLENQHSSKTVNQQTDKIALSTKEKRKYGTYLREESILNIQIQAAQERKKDHELLQEIIDYYYENRKK